MVEDIRFGAHSALKSDITDFREAHQELCAFGAIAAAIEHCVTALGDVRSSSPNNELFI